MDLDSLTKGISLFGSAIATVKQIIMLIPDKSKREEAEAYLERAEREFKIAESESATSLGYEICRQHFPPVIMLSKDNQVWECPECHNMKRPDDYNWLG